MKFTIPIPFPEKKYSYLMDQPLPLNPIVLNGFVLRNHNKFSIFIPIIFVDH